MRENKKFFIEKAGSSRRQVCRRLDSFFLKKNTHEIRVAARVHHNGYGYTQLNLNLNRIFWFFGVKDLNQTFKLVIN